MDAQYIFNTLRSVLALSNGIVCHFHMQGEWTTTGRKGRKKLQGDLDLILAPGDSRSKPSPRTGDRGTSRAGIYTTTLYHLLWPSVHILAHSRTRMHTHLRTYTYTYIYTHLRTYTYPCIHTAHIHVTYQLHCQQEITMEEVCTWAQRGGGGVASHRVVVVDGAQVAGVVTAHDQLGR